jgi:VIT1/CCC1 family predicted Fe2+/Mn2+ transporter
MARARTHSELHRSQRTGWLRAAVLGSNDAIVSTASLMLGVAASAASKGAILIAGVAGMVAGAMSMAVGEYLSVSSQRDAEQADIEIEKHELARDPQSELRELESIYVRRGLEAKLAREVALQLSARDGLSAHLRDELGITPGALPRPFQAAWVSALSFASFASIPNLALLAAPADQRGTAIVATSLLALAGLGGLGARLGGAPLLPAVVRVTVGGGLAMAVTAAIGRLLGIAAG